MLQISSDVAENYGMMVLGSPLVIARLEPQAGHSMASCQPRASQINQNLIQIQIQPTRMTCDSDWGQLWIIWLILFDTMWLWYGPLTVQTWIINDIIPRSVSESRS